MVVQDGAELKLDLSNYDNFTNGVPHAFFARLRQEEPVHWSSQTHGLGFWSITRHPDILTLNRDYRLMSSARGIRIEDQTREEFEARKTFQETDPPEHTWQRLIVSQAFSAGKLLQYEGEIRRIIKETVDFALQKREFDFAVELARKLPMRILGQILSIPEVYHDWLLGQAEKLFANADHDFTDYVVDRVNTDSFRLLPFRSPAGSEVFDFAQQLLRDQIDRGAPQSLLNLILMPDRNGNSIEKEEFRNFFCLLIVSGNDTLRHALAAIVHQLARQPLLVEQKIQHLGKPDATFWATAVDEWLRWCSPYNYYRRTATRDFSLHGKTIRAGDKVVLWLVSGNRDESVFTKPDEVNLLRNPNPHLAFGEGSPHNCLGAWLSRLVLKLFIQEWVARVESTTILSEPEYLRSNFLNGIKKLPIALRGRDRGVTWSA
ncbi:MAG: cytochrome P450 [Alphaproteobacteria bacterium]|nr:cytochrome P450 [Alphaproteobacteria bacterium]